MSDRPSRPPKPASARPQSVREGLAPDAETPEIEIESRELEVGGVIWTVHVAGRARVRSGGAGTPLLDLRFESAVGETLEALAIGRRLELLTEDQLEAALASARPHEPNRARRGFFEGTDQGSRRPRG